MRVIHVSEYEHERMQLGKPILDQKGRTLLAAGSRVNPRFLERLTQMGISQLIVEDAESSDITLEEMLDLPTWNDALLVMSDVFEQVKKKGTFHLLNVQKLTNNLIEETNSRKAVILIPTSTLSAEFQPYGHMVNVALLALQIGKKLGYNMLQLRDLAVGSLLHDIGKAVTQDDKKHPEAGFKILRNITEISLMSAHIAFQHHETFDGKGFPRGISGTKVLEYAQICGIANTFDHLISQKHIPPHEAIEYIMALSNKDFQPKVVEAFIHSTPAYPPGKKVLLNDDTEAIVVRIDQHMQRPVVRKMESNEEISLADHPNMTIKHEVESRFTSYKNVRIND